VRLLVPVVLAAACGRFGFEQHGGGTDAPGDTGDGAAAGVVTWVKTFAAQGNSASTLGDSFAGSATAGDAVVLQLFCANTVVPTGVTLTASGWSFVQLGALVGSTSSGYWGTSFGAIAPDSASTTFTATWTAASPCTFIVELGDELAGVDTSGAFDAHAELLSNGNCATTVLTASANDAIWAACTVNDVTSTGAGFTKSADDGHGDWSEYKLTTDPAGTPEGVLFQTSTGMDDYVVTAVAIKPG